MTRRQRELGLWAFQRRLIGEGGPAADLKRWVSLQPQERREQGLLVPTWTSRTGAAETDQSATSTKLCASKSKNTCPRFVFFPSRSLNFSSYPPSYSLLSLTILFGSPWTHLLSPPSESPICWVGQNLAGLPAVQVQVGSSPKGPPPPSTHFFQMPINRCKKCWPGLRDQCLHNN